MTKEIEGGDGENQEFKAPKTTRAHNLPTSTEYTGPTAEELKAQIAELQAKLSTIDHDATTIDSIEHSLNYEELAANCKMNIYTIQAGLSETKKYIEKKLKQKIIFKDKNKIRMEIIDKLYKNLDDILLKSYEFLRQIFSGGKFSSTQIKELNTAIWPNGVKSKQNPEMIRIYKWVLAVNTLVDEVRISFLQQKHNMSLKEALQNIDACIEKINGFEYKEPPDIAYEKGEGQWY